MDHPPNARASERLAEAIAAAIAGNRLAADGRAVRRDGWTAERIGIFLEALADCGSVTRAAAVAGVSARAAYKFRARAQGRAFGQAWDLAYEIARPIEPFVERPPGVCIKITIRNGHVWERHFLDNRRLMATLRRLDRVAEACDRDPFAEHDFETLVDRACAAAAVPRVEPQPRRTRDLCEHSEGLEGQAASRAAAPPALAAPAAIRPRARARAIARWGRPRRELNPAGRRLARPARLSRSWLARPSSDRHGRGPPLRPIHRNHLC